jgi:IS30 family transposase
MPQAYYATDERIAPQAMEGMLLPTSYRAAIPGKSPSGIYGGLSRNGTDSMYTGSESRKSSVQRRMDNKPSPKLDDHTLTREIMGLLKQDLSAGRISGRFEALCR